MTTKKQTEKKAQKPATTKKVDVKRIQTDVKAGLAETLDETVALEGGSGWRTW